jgi:hypothetical protein
MRIRFTGLLAPSIVAAGFIALITMANAHARPGPHGMMGGGRHHDGAGHHQDMQGIHALFAHRSEIRRTVKEISGGVEAVTESETPAVAAQIQEHVASMYRRLEERRPIHARDPLFAELFRNADKITMKIEHTAKGVKVRETSTDPRVVRLIRRHAEVVSAFLANGHREMMRDHALPD